MLSPLLNGRAVPHSAPTENPYNLSEDAPGATKAKRTSIKKQPRRAEAIALAATQRCKRPHDSELPPLSPPKFPETIKTTKEKFERILSRLATIRVACDACIQRLGHDLQMSNKICPEQLLREAKRHIKLSQDIFRGSTSMEASIIDDLALLEALLEKDPGGTGIIYSRAISNYAKNADNLASQIKATFEWIERNEKKLLGTPQSVTSEEKQTNAIETSKANLVEMALAHSQIDTALFSKCLSKTLRALDLPLQGELKTEQKERFSKLIFVTFLTHISSAHEESSIFEKLPKAVFNDIVKEAHRAKLFHP